MARHPTSANADGTRPLRAGRAMLAALVLLVQLLAAWHQPLHVAVPGDAVAAAAEEHGHAAASAETCLLCALAPLALLLPALPGHPARLRAPLPVTRPTVAGRVRERRPRCRAPPR